MVRWEPVCFTNGEHCGMPMGKSTGPTNSFTGRSVLPVTSAQVCGTTTVCRHNQVFPPFPQLPHAAPLTGAMEVMHGFTLPTVSVTITVPTGSTLARDIFCSEQPTGSISHGLCMMSVLYCTAQQHVVQNKTCYTQHRILICCGNGGTYGAVCILNWHMHVEQQLLCDVDSTCTVLDAEYWCWP